MVSKISKAISYKEKVYDELKSLILSNQIKPGELLNERSLAEKLGISRTPLREAIQVLESEGWLKTEPWKGVYVSEITKHDIAEVMQLRMVLEPLVVELIIKDINEEQICEIERLFKKQKDYYSQENGVEFIRTDKEFHMYLAQLTGNQRLIQILANLSDMVTRLGMRAIARYNRYKETLWEHQNIIRSLKDKDVNSARQAMIYHVLTTEKNWQVTDHDTNENLTSPD